MEENEHYHAGCGRSNYCIGRMYTKDMKCHHCVERDGEQIPAHLQREIKRLEKKAADGNYGEQGDLSTKTSATSPASESSPTPTAQVPLTLYVIMAFLSCALNAVSGFLDKVLMKDITSSQLQFWYMLFLVIFYIIFALVSHQKIEVGKTLKNKWVWILSILFIIADRALFIANGMEESRVTVMTLIKQSGAIVTIVSGRVVFKEKGTVHKMICALIIIAGIFLGVLK